MLPDGSLPPAYLEDVARVLSTPRVHRNLEQEARGHPVPPSTLATLAPGLTAADLRAAEEFVGAPFPPDLRSLLTAFVPMGRDFPDWRTLNEKLFHRVDWVRAMSAFDVEHNPQFWFADWGVRPDGLSDALKAMHRELKQAPILVPLYAHRGIPVEPGEAGNPVFSMHGLVDTISYGNDLADYFFREFGVPRPAWARDEPRPIRFWDMVVSGEWGGSERWLAPGESP